MARDLEFDREEMLVLLAGVGMMLADRRRQKLSDASPDSHFLVELRAKIEWRLSHDSNT